MFNREKGANESWRRRWRKIWQKIKLQESNFPEENNNNKKNISENVEGEFLHNHRHTQYTAAIKKN